MLDEIEDLQGFVNVLVIGIENGFPRPVTLLAPALMTLPTEIDSLVFLPCIKLLLYLWKTAGFRRESPIPDHWAILCP